MLLLIVALLYGPTYLLAKVFQIVADLLDCKAWPEIVFEVISHRVIKVVLLEAIRVRNELLTHELLELKDENPLNNLAELDVKFL